MTRKSKPKRTTARPKGYDFGVKRRAIMVSSPDFMEALSRADVIGTAYGLARSPQFGGAALPHIALIATNADELRRAFLEFQRWSEESGDEAVELTFVFLKGGGYVLGISPRTEFLRRRFGEFDSVLEPIYVTGTWLKYIPTRHPFLDQFREAKQARVIAPFFFSGALHPPTKCDADVKPATVRPLPGVEDILKFHVRFCDEDAITPHSPEWLVFEAYRALISKAPNSKAPPHGEPPRQTPADWFERRAHVLNRHFPVTLERSRLRKLYHDTFGNLQSEGVRRWQFEQAVCNLVLSNEMCEGAYHYATLRKGRLATDIDAALRNRFEEATGDDELSKHLTVELVRHQIRLDISTLLVDLGYAFRTTDIAALLRFLEQEDMLGGADSNGFAASSS
jgi:hypothetical protein